MKPYAYVATSPTSVHVICGQSLLETAHRINDVNGLNDFNIVAHYPSGRYCAVAPSHYCKDKVLGLKDAKDAAETLIDLLSEIIDTSNSSWKYSAQTIAELTIIRDSAKTKKINFIKHLRDNAVMPGTTKRLLDDITIQQNEGNWGS